MRVLVAGDQGGIGRACAESVRESGGQVHGVDAGTTDITLPGGAEAAVEQAHAALGGLDGVVHAIGMSGRRLGDGRVTECTDEAWAQVHRVNHESVFRLLRASIPRLGSGGSVVIVGSVLATSLDRDFRTVAYASAKGALIPLVRSAAYDAAPAGVRVNLVAAGLVDIPMARRALGSERIVARMAELMPLGGTPCTPQEVADVVTWLLSPAAGRTTGAVVPVDGGWHLR
ncbi:SDR family oxidoreductase [Nonomuraea sp. FMUSA5-5]|uniref:SDR family oxidoreductase n=1 Tax=Nonomuraea composti TaxID=2720023 RepID=A0ABX1BMC6_9ACTN|nr:SDR family oxidoreductase [Nonomuraea sp. FMUSA5-5]NJP97452.1 SDR family oxidoreductase [Nonomuraea sp. FMUSA5-5]